MPAAADLLGPPCPFLPVCCSYGLSWSAQREGYLLSGSDDAQICVWDVKGTTQSNRVCVVGSGWGRAGQGRACRVARAAIAAGLQQRQLVLLVFSLPCALISQAPSLPRCRSNWRRCTSSRAIWGWWRMWRGTRGTQTCLAAWATTRSWWVHEHVKGWLLEALCRPLDCTTGWRRSLCP